MRAGLLNSLGAKTDRLLSLCLMVLTLLLTHTGCDSSDSENEDFVLMLNIDDGARVQSGMHVQVTVSVMVSGGGVNEMKGETFDSYNGSRTLFNVGGGEVGKQYSYDWVVPYMEEDSVAVTLTVSATDNEGHHYSLKRRVLVVGGDYLLRETTGMSLYATDEFNRPDVITLYPLSLNLWSAVDSARRDIYPIRYEEGAQTDAEAMTRAWTSDSGLLFARLNSFDYPNATQKSVTTVWRSVVALSRISEIVDDDIILVGTAADGCKAVIKVVSVLEQDGVANDRYLINIKTIRQLETKTN